MTTGDGRHNQLAPVERELVEHVERGEILDLTRNDPVDEAEMRAWGEAQTIRAWVLREIVRGRLAPDPDPRGLRLRGARIIGRLDLDNITSTVSLALNLCLLDEGMSASGGHLADLVLERCRLKHPTQVPLFAKGLVATSITLDGTSVIAHNASGAAYLIDARIGPLSCGGAVLQNDSGPALEASRLQSDGDVFLSDGFSATGCLDRGAVRLVGARINGTLECDGATLHNSSGPALEADRLQTSGSVFLRKEFSAAGAGESGAVRLRGAHIGGQLDCSGATLHNDVGPALQADGLKTDREVFLRRGFSATGAGELGAVRLVMARIGSQLDCRGAVLRNDSGPALRAEQLRIDHSVLFFDGFSATGSGEGVTLNLSDLRVGGTLVFAPTQLQHLQSTQHRMAVDGLVYKGLPQNISTDCWLQLLRDATPVYAAQPYQQLAAAQRAAGHDREARRVLIQQRRDQIHRRALTGRAERAWARITGLVLGYGYQPWRALLGLLATFVIAALMAAILGGHGGLSQIRTSLDPTPGDCTFIQRIGVGLDLGTPLVSPGPRTRCDTTSTSMGEWLIAAGWALRLLAWAFATLFIAGFTGAVRKT